MTRRDILSHKLNGFFESQIWQAMQVARHLQKPFRCAPAFQTCWGSHPNPPTRRILLGLRLRSGADFEKILSFMYCSNEGEKRKLEVSFRK